MNVEGPGGRCEDAHHPEHERFVRTAFEAHRQMLIGRSWAATRDAAVADDVVQDAFTRLLHEACNGQAPVNAGAWLHRVAMNLIASRARRAEVDRRYLPALARALVAESAEAAVERREQARTIARALNELPPSDRALILLAAGGATGAQIASWLGRTELAARTALCRARARLRQNLALA